MDLVGDGAMVCRILMEERGTVKQIGGGGASDPDGRVEEIGEGRGTVK